jgi:hypothetical protein
VTVRPGAFGARSLRSVTDRDGQGTLAAINHRFR